MFLFDLESFFTGGKFSYHFNPSGFYNGKNSWLSDDSTVKIIWDTTLNAWKLSGDTLGTTQVINTNPNYPPINGNWTVLGQSYSVAANQGVCSPADALTMVYNYTNPGCICDGSINITASGGVPPYQYSYNNGVTYLSTPIKDGLCGGDSYQIIVKDSNGDTITQLIQMDGVIPQTTYTLNLVDYGRVVISNTSWIQKYRIQVTPSLPNGVTINFGLQLSSVFQRTPFANSANSSYVTQIKKNGTIITTYTDNTTETTGANTSPGCQNYLTYRTNYEYGYSNLTLNNTDVYEISGVYEYQLTCSNPPPSTQSSILMGEENDSTLGPLTFDLEDYATTYRNCCFAYFPIESSPTLYDLSIVGCNCCKVNHWSYFYNRS